MLNRGALRWCPTQGQPQAARQTLECVRSHAKTGHFNKGCLRAISSRSSEHEHTPASLPVSQALVLAAGLVGTASSSVACPPPVHAAVPPPTSTATNLAPAKGKRARGSNKEAQQQQQQQQQEVLRTVPADPQHQPAPPLAVAAVPTLLALLTAATYFTRRSRSPLLAPAHATASSASSNRDVTALSHALRSASGRAQGLLHVLGSRTSSRGGVLPQGLIGAGQSLRGLKPTSPGKRGAAEGVRAGAGRDTLDRPQEQQQQEQQAPGLQPKQQLEGGSVLEQERGRFGAEQGSGGKSTEVVQLSLAEEILRWTYAIQRGTEEEAAETIWAANKLAESLLKEQQPPGGSGDTQSEADVRWRKYDGIAALVDFMGGLPEQLEARSWKQLWQPLPVDTATPEGAAELLRILDPTADPSAGSLPESAEGGLPAVSDQQQQQQQQQRPGSESSEVARATEQLRRRAQAAADASKMQGLVLCVGAAARELEAAWEAEARAVKEREEREEPLMAVESQAAELRAAAEREVRESREREEKAREERWVQAAAAAAAGEEKRRAQAAAAATEEENLLRAAAAAAAAAEEEERQLQAAAAAAGEEQKRAHAAAAAAAAEEERQQAEVRALALERQQQRQALLEADWQQRRAAWGARRAAAESERKQAAARAAAHAREAAVRAGARAQEQRWREAAARLAAENRAERDASAVRAHAEVVRQREEAEQAVRERVEREDAEARALVEREAQEARRAAEAYAAVLAEEARAAAAAEEELRRADEEAEAARQRLAAQEREAKQRMLRAQEAVAKAQARAAYATSLATAEASAARAHVAAEAQAYASQLAKAADLHWSLAQQAVLAAQTRVASTQRTLDARRAAALQRVREKEQEEEARAREKAQAQAPPRLRSGSLADWAPPLSLRSTRKSGAAAKYDPLEQLASMGAPQPQWQEVAHEVLSLEAVVGSGLPRYSPREVLCAAHPGKFVDACQDLERLLAQPRRLAKVHPAISAWIQASSDAAVVQQRQTSPSWKLWPIWVTLHGPQHQHLYEAALKAWPTFSAELELRHSDLHKLVCKGTESRLDPEGNKVRGLALLATLAAWRGAEQHSVPHNGSSPQEKQEKQQLEQPPRGGDQASQPGQLHGGASSSPLARKREAVGAS